MQVFICSKCGNELEKPRVKARHGYAVCQKCQMEKVRKRANERYNMLKLREKS